MSPYEFALGAFVMLKMSSEKGEVRGRAEYLSAENSYFVRYVCADGRQVEDWIGESALRVQPLEVQRVASA